MFFDNIKKQIDLCMFILDLMTTLISFTNSKRFGVGQIL